VVVQDMASHQNLVEPLSLSVFALCFDISNRLRVPDESN
jgi:hypothetical protein